MVSSLFCRMMILMLQQQQVNQQMQHQQNVSQYLQGQYANAPWWTDAAMSYWPPGPPEPPAGSLSLSYGPDLGDTRSGGRMGRFKKSKKIKKNKKKQKTSKKNKKTKRTKKHMHHCFSLAWAIILWSAFDKVLGGGRACN